MISVCDDQGNVAGPRSLTEQSKKTEQLNQTIRKGVGGVWKRESVK